MFNYKKNINLMFGIFMAFLAFKPIILSVDPKYDTLYSMLTYLSLMIFFSIAIYNLIVLKKLKLTSQWLILLLFMLWLMVSSLINVNNNTDQVLTFLSIIGFISIFDITNKYFKYIIRGVDVYCIILILVNLITQLLYPTEGLYHNWANSWQPYYVCGNGNSFVFFYLFSAGIASIDFYLSKKDKFPLWVLIYEAILYYSISLEHTSTGKAVILLLIIITFFSTRVVINILRKHYKKVGVFILGIFLFFIIYGGWKEKLVQNIIYDFTGENANLIARGEIWVSSINSVLKSPILGYGANSFNLAIGDGGLQRSAHNNYLQIMLLGGIPSLIMYVSFIALSFKSFSREKTRQDKASYYCSIIILLYLVAYFFEQNPYNIGFFTFCFLVSKIAKTNE